MFFKNEYAFLSNFYQAPFVFKGVTFDTVEHFFQAQKATTKSDYMKIANADSPGEAKKIGRHIDLRPDWPDIKEKVMTKGVYEKFRQNPDLISKLLEVKEPIVEDNTWGDTYWGACDGKGKNRLGIILEKAKIYFENSEEVAV